MNPAASPATPAALADFQRAFFDALWAPAGAAGALAAQPGFAVYRNSVLAACIDALEANYPVLTALLGRDWLRAAAADYARATLPREVCLMRYGDDFGDFVAALPTAAGLPYVADVARLERLWRESHLAADAAPLDARQLQALAPAALPTLRLAPHPATRWHWFADTPALGLWQAHQAPAGAPRDAALQALRWQAEGALLSRVHGQVRVTRVDRASCRLLDACAAGQPLAEALAAALTAEAEEDAAADPDHTAPPDAGALLQRLLDAGALRALAA